MEVETLPSIFAPAILRQATDLAVDASSEGVKTVVAAAIEGVPALTREACEQSILPNIEDPTARTFASHMVTGATEQCHLVGQRTLQPAADESIDGCSEGSKDWLHEHIDGCFA